MGGRGPRGREARVSLREPELLGRGWGAGSPAACGLGGRCVCPLAFRLPEFGSFRAKHLAEAWGERVAAGGRWPRCCSA